MFIHFPKPTGLTVGKGRLGEKGLSLLLDLVYHLFLRSDHQKCCDENSFFRKASKNYPRVKQEAEQANELQSPL